MPALLATLLLVGLLIPAPQERREDNAWLRCKPGTWVKNKVTTETPDQSWEDVQTLTLKESEGDDYVIEESYKAAGQPPARGKRSRGVKTGEETLTIAGKEYKCTITTVKGTNEQGPTLGRFWTPQGSRNAVKIEFEQKGMVGKLFAVDVDAKVPALGKTYTCNKLEGRLKMGEVDGTLRLVLCEDIPGAQIEAEVRFKGPAGDTKVRFEVQEVHEEK